MHHTRDEHGLAPARRAALLAGELDDLAVAVDDVLPLAHYHPAPGDAGGVDEFEVTAAMAEIYQSQTSAEVAARDQRRGMRLRLR